MRYDCKYCGKNQTGNVIQNMYNSFILSGKKIIDSSRNEVKYKEIEWCKCKEL